MAVWVPFAKALSRLEIFDQQPQRRIVRSGVGLISAFGEPTADAGFGIFEEETGLGTLEAGLRFSPSGTSAQPRIILQQQA
jgi:hypothetical protein